jgi:hypothetical protein
MTPTELFFKGWQKSAFAVQIFADGVALATGGDELHSQRLVRDRHPKLRKNIDAGNADGVWRSQH